MTSIKVLKVQNENQLLSASQTILLRPFKKMFATVSNQVYVNNVDEQNDLFFIDLGIRYSMSSKTTFSIQAKNLLNSKNFTIISVDELASYYEDYRLLPAMALFEVSYRF